MITFPQVANNVDLRYTDKTASWRSVPGVNGFIAHPDGCVRRADDWRMTGAIHPVEGFVVPIAFEGQTVYVPARYLVAAAHLPKPGRVLVDNGRGGLAFVYDVARRNGQVLDDRAQNLYWHELPEPIDFEFLMREARWARRPQGVSPASVPYGE